MLIHCAAALMDETINCSFSSPIKIMTKGRGSFQASVSLQSLQYILQHISKVHTLCMMRGEINQYHISGFWVTVAPLIIWEIWKRGGVTHIWQKPWLIFITIWSKNTLSDCFAGNNLHSLIFWSALWVLFFILSFPTLNYNVLLNETDTNQAGRINADIIHSFSSWSQHKTIDHLSDQCWFGHVSGVEMLDMVLDTEQCKTTKKIIHWWLILSFRSKILRSVGTVCENT